MWRLQNNVRGAVTAVSAVSGKQNIQHVSCFLINLTLQPRGPISWSSPTKYFTVFFVANFAVQNHLAQVTGKSSPHHLPSHFLCKFVGFVGGRIRITRAGVY